MYSGGKEKGEHANQEERGKEEQMEDDPEHRWSQTGKMVRSDSRRKRGERHTHPGNGQRTPQNRLHRIARKHRENTSPHEMLPYISENGKSQKHYPYHMLERLWSNWSSDTPVVGIQDASTTLESRLMNSFEQICST